MKLFYMYAYSSEVIKSNYSMVLNVFKCVEVFSVKHTNKYINVNGNYHCNSVQDGNIESFSFPRGQHLDVEVYLHLFCICFIYHFWDSPVGYNLALKELVWVWLFSIYFDKKFPGQYMYQHNQMVICISSIIHNPFWDISSTNSIYQKAWKRLRGIIDFYSICRYKKH